ncbi:MAG: XRE family transcriptional regulator [Clostridia bacterium]|nr:XRE family transcriptional regulator [Clostridia bacterium]
MFRNLDAELKRKGMTRGDLAKAMNITPSTMSMKLNGKSGLTLNEAMRIKAILDVDIPIEQLFYTEMPTTKSA